MKFDLAVDKIVTGPFQENTFVVRDVISQKALIIDPGDDENTIVAFIKREKLKPLAILNTHAHLDHIGAVSKLQKLFQIPFYLHKKEKMILDLYEQSCEMFGLPVKQKPVVDEWITNDSSRIVGSRSTVAISSGTNHVRSVGNDQCVSNT